MSYEQGSYKYAWRIGPGIRECCLHRGLAQAAWWWEVDQRFKDLSRNGLENQQTLAEALLRERPLIEELLASVVPRPTNQDRREYERFRKRIPMPRRVKLKLPGFVTILGIPWPCSEEHLKARWKRLAFEFHPDRGGTQADFVRVERAYRQALEFIS